MDGLAISKRRTNSIDEIMELKSDVTGFYLRGVVIVLSAVLHERETIHVTAIAACSRLQGGGEGEGALLVSDEMSHL